jgi:putative hydrolase of the HAD superfamily
LEAVYKINVQEFLDYVHDIPIKNYLQSDEELRQTLALYPSRKIIFTNADTNHARRVLCTLGVDEFFEQVIDIHAIRPFCKPQPEAFEKALTIAGVIDPTKCVMIDDSYPNLVSAHEMGLFTIQVGTEVRSSLVDAVVLTLFDLPSVLPVKITEV